jgi:DNA-binding transcriptional ArsR family regulator
MTTNSLFQGPFLAVPVWAAEEIRDHGQARDLQVLVGLVALMERRTQEVRASINQIAEYVMVSPKTVQRSLKWLEEHRVVLTTRRGKPAVNVYKIIYQKPTNRVTGDLFNRSAVTYSSTHDGAPNRSPVTYSNGPFSWPDQGIREIAIEILDISDIEVLKRAASGGGEDMIFGADPDREDVPFDPAPKKKPNRKLGRLVTQFIGDPRVIMSRTYSTQEVVILKRTLNTLADSGLTEFTISQMIKRFLDVEHWRNSDNPVLTFSSKAVQKKLMEQTDATVAVDNPVLSFVVNDFQRGDLDLPWDDRASDQVIRNTVIMYGMDICYRYPELVVYLIENSSGGTSEEFKPTLSTLNSLVRVIAGEEDGDPVELRESLTGVPLPDELIKLSKENLRPQAASITEAVYNYRRINHGRK